MHVLKICIIPRGFREELLDHRQKRICATPPPKKKKKKKKRKKKKKEREINRSKICSEKLIQCKYQNYLKLTPNSTFSPLIIHVHVY